MSQIVKVYGREILDSRGNVVWIPGIIKSQFDKKQNDDYDIILKYE